MNRTINNLVEMIWFLSWCWSVVGGADENKFKSCNRCLNLCIEREIDSHDGIPIRKRAVLKATFLDEYDTGHGTLSDSLTYTINRALRIFNSRTVSDVTCRIRSFDNRSEDSSAKFPIHLRQLSLPMGRFSADRGRVINLTACSTTNFKIVTNPPTSPHIAVTI